MKITFFFVVYFSLFIITVLITGRGFFDSILKGNDEFGSSLPIYGLLISILLSLGIWSFLNQHSLWLRLPVTLGSGIAVFIFIFIIYFFGMITLPNSDSHTLRLSTLISGLLILFPLITSMFLIWQSTLKSVH